MSKHSTEYGVAHLLGKSIRERALALIEMAHPNCREELLDAAKRQGCALPEQYLASQAAYPVHEERAVKLKNGATFLIRPAHASDAGALRDRFHHLTPDQVYTRFVLPVGAFALLCSTADAVQRQPGDRGRLPGGDGTARERDRCGQCLLLSELDDEPSPKAPSW